MKNIKKRYQSNICIIVFITVISLFVGYSSAKYLYQINGDSLFRAKEFYFESNLLRNEDVEYILNPNTTEISFTLTNSLDELRTAEDDIEYVISVDNGATLSKSSGSLIKNVVSSELITLSNLEKGNTYTVTATGKAGYKKTLEAKFTVSDSDKNLWKHLDVNDEYVLLTVWTENLSGEISIDFPAGLIPDNTDNIMSNVVNFNGAEYLGSTINDNQNFTHVYSTHIYRFFIDKDTGSNLIPNSFVVRNTVSTDPLKIVLGNIGTLE